MKNIIKRLNKKQRIWAFIIFGLIVAAVVAVALFLLLKPNDVSDQDIDYNQPVTSIDGSKLNTVYKVESGGTYAVRFPDLSCSDNCNNVSELRLGDKLLKRGEDYELKEGSIIVILLEKVLSVLKTGQYDLTFRVTDGENSVAVGLSITIENNSAKCGKNQTLKDGKCVDTEQTENNSESESANSSSNNNTEGHTENQNNTAVNNNENSNNNNQNNNSNNQPNTEPAPSNEPSNGGSNETPQPQNEPEPVHTEEFNLNDGYMVNYFGVHIYMEDENHNILTDENGNYLGSFTYGSCEIMKDSVVLKKTYFTSNAHGISLEQQEAERAAAEASGLNGGQGGGYLVNLDEQYCGICGVSCGRW